MSDDRILEVFIEKMMIKNLLYSIKSKRATPVQYSGQKSERERLV